MADLTSSSISAYAGRAQLLGLGSNGFNTQAMLQLELDIINMRKDPYIEQKNGLKLEKEHWNQLQIGLNNFNKVITDLKDFSRENKQVLMDLEGYFTATATNGAMDASYDIEIQRVATSHRIMSDVVPEGPLGYTETVQINEKDFEITSDMSAKDVAVKINEGDYGVSAVVLDNKLVLTAEGTGTDNQIKLSNSALFELAGLTSGGVIKNELQQAADAEFKINGVSMTSSSNTVTEIDGLTLTLQKPTNGQVGFNVEHSTDSFLESVKKLVDGYNGVIRTIKNYAGEGKELQGESIVRRLQTGLGGIISGSVINGQTLNSLGISFDRDLGDGMIKLDEATLRKQFENDNVATMNVFSGAGSLSEQLSKLVNEISSPTGLIESEKNGIDTRIERIDKTLERFDINFESRQESLLMKYAQLDVMLANLEMQRDYIDAQLGQFEMDANKR